MNKTSILLILILFTLLPAQAIKKVEANPVNIAFMLAQETDTAKMVSTLDYYGYESQPSQNGYTVFKHKNTSIIRYSFKDAIEEQPYPYVEVKSKLSAKDIDMTLTDLIFKKEGNRYVRKLGQHARSSFSCTHGPQGFLIFHQTKIMPQQ